MNEPLISSDPGYNQTVHSSADFLKSEDYFSKKKKKSFYEIIRPS